MKTIDQERKVVEENLRNAHRVIYAIEQNSGMERDDFQEAWGLYGEAQDQIYKIRDGKFGPVYDKKNEAIKLANQIVLDGLKALVNESQEFLDGKLVEFQTRIKTWQVILADGKDTRELAKECGKLRMEIERVCRDRLAQKEHEKKQKLEVGENIAQMKHVIGQAHGMRKPYLEVLVEMFEIDAETKNVEHNLVQTKAAIRFFESIKAQIGAPLKV